MSKTLGATAVEPHRQMVRSKGKSYRTIGSSDTLRTAFAIDTGMS
jgi:hypothetical protein